MPASPGNAERGGRQRLTRIHVEAALAPGTRVTLTGAPAVHLARVLRLKAGAELVLFNGDGLDYPSVIKELRRGTVLAEVRATAPARAESPLALTLVQGIARGERMDLVVQKASELGVHAIQPVLSARSMVRLDPAARRAKLAHWRGIAIAACEQSGRARLPVLGEPLALADWLARPADPALRRLLLDPAGPAALAGAARGAAAAELLVGPEGGLDDAERDGARQTGYLSCRLGPRVLRSETAAIAALAVLQAAAGDLG